MPDRIRITVCVVALTQADYQDPAVQAKLAAVPGIYDFTTPGKPYAASPDEWRPFSMGPPIREYLEKANLEASLLSTQLYDNAAKREVLKKTNLYIIDPLTLIHSQKGDLLAEHVQTAIYVSSNDANSKAFCIILPADLPATLRTEIADMCASRLRDLCSIRDDDDSYEWEVEDADRLNRYLKGLARRLASKPDPYMLLLVQQALQGRGVPAPKLDGPPQMTS
jgi:hypothetical protein